MYLCLCHTCEEERTVDSLDRAQEWFTGHVDRGHEPEFRRQEELSIGASPADDEDAVSG